MRKPPFSRCENKGADQLRGDRATDQRLCLRYIDITITLLPKSEISSLFYGCTARFLYDHVGNPQDRFSRDVALFCYAIFAQGFLFLQKSISAEQAITMPESCKHVRVMNTPLHPTFI